VLVSSRSVTRVWPHGPRVAETLERPREDFVLEQRTADGEFEQVTGPFIEYRRRVERRGDQWHETTTYRLLLPWFGWLFRFGVRALVARRYHAHDTGPAAVVPAALKMPWWAPPDRLDQRQVLVLGLLGAASMSSAFINTVFTQTVKFAADDFGVGNSGIGLAGSVVRAGIVLALPAAILADRIGRRRVVSAVAWAAPLVTALGALAPNFALLVASQAVGRPLGLALGFLIAVIAAEEMPRSSRAYAISVLALASGLGAGVAVAALPLADLDPGAWRWVFLVTLIWLPVAVDISRRLPETGRFQLPHVTSPRLHRKRFTILAIVAVAANLFIAPASFFQNAYLRDVREYSGTLIAIFTFATATPAAVGLIIGGRLADLRGRRGLLAVTLPFSTMFLVISYTYGGGVMWFGAFLGGFVGSLAYPALAVYRAELFPTGNRGKAAGLLSATALLGGIFGLLIAGHLLDAAWSYGHVMGLLSIGQVVVVITVLASYPETAHRTLEDLNPEDQPLDQHPAG
jgi:MFS family permease